MTPDERKTKLDRIISEFQLMTDHQLAFASLMALKLYCELKDKNDSSFESEIKDSEEIIGEINKEAKFRLTTNRKQQFTRFIRHLSERIKDMDDKEIENRLKVTQSLKQSISHQNDKPAFEHIKQVEKLVLGELKEREKRKTWKPTDADFTKLLRDCIQKEKGHE